MTGSPAAAASLWLRNLGLDGPPEAARASQGTGGGREPDRPELLRGKYARVSPGFHLKMHLSAFLFPRRERSREGVCEEEEGRAAPHPELYPGQARGDGGAGRGAPGHRQGHAYFPARSMRHLSGQLTLRSEGNAAVRLLRRPPSTFTGTLGKTGVQVRSPPTQRLVRGAHTPNIPAATSD